MFSYEILVLASLKKIDLPELSWISPVQEGRETAEQNVHFVGKGKVLQRG